jgi:hypothetical protein
MATFMSSNFTAPDRRKKAVTYGKASRLAPIPPPTASSDAPSPERPRKHTALSNGFTKRNGGAVKTTSGSQTTRADTGSVDIFDVPSDDEFSTRPVKPTKPLAAKHRIADDTGSEKNGRVTGSNKLAGKGGQAARKVEQTKSVVPAPRNLQKSVQPPKAAPASLPTPGPSVARSTRQGKTPQPAQGIRQNNGARPGTQREAGKAKAVSRESTPDRPHVKSVKVAKSGKTKTSLPTQVASAKISAKPSQQTDVFDVPSSEDDAHMPTPKPTRRAPIITRKEPAKPQKTIDAQEEIVESVNTEALPKRKRRGSVSSGVATKSRVGQTQDESLPQRSRKHQKQNAGDSPGRDQAPPLSTVTQVNAQIALPVVNKPRRTRLRTVPILTRPPVAKGQSSPASLYSMLPEGRISKPSPVSEAPEASAVEDETMYEIPESSSTPVRPSNVTSGSVTPRQKALFGSLLSTTPMPSISRLQLTERKPASLLGALSRSKSDISHSTQSRKTRLIASLKHAEAMSDDEASDSESEISSEGQMVVPKTKTATANRRNNNAQSPHATLIESDDMDVNNEVAADSQTSQATSGFGGRPKFTYAKSRSYLQEANPEDAMLMSMDLDEPITFGSQTKDSQTEEEEEASQVRPNHELKRQGRNTKFHWDNQMLIDDIATRSTNSIRRSAVLELCTKMADGTFAHELLDSSLADEFFENTTSNGDIIFDFAVAVAAIFMLRGKPDFTALDQVYRSKLPSSLLNLLDNDTDIVKIAKNRKTNLSRIAQDSVVTFRSMVLASSVWSTSTPAIVSPQLVALKALDLLVVGLRNAGNVESIVSQDTTGKLVDIVASVSERCKDREATEEAKLVLSTIFSILEAVSLAKQKQTSWSVRMLQRLAGAMPVSFLSGDASTITLAVKLCMNLTNNKPKACQQFSDAIFVRSLIQSIIDRTAILHADVHEVQRAEALDTLILSLGAMINLTEHSDQARTNVDDGGHLIETLVKTFVEGSVRTAQVSLFRAPFRGARTNVVQAVSMEESQSSVAVGYLSVLLGNMCLNKAIKSKIRAHLPGQRLTTLIEKIREFVQVHEHVNRKAKHFEGEEGQETWQAYTTRIMQVVEQLEGTAM